MHAITDKLKRCFAAVALWVAPPRTQFASQRYTSVRFGKARKADGRFLFRGDPSKVFNLPTFRVWAPAIQGGDPALILDDKVKELDDAVKAKRTEAQTAWATFDEKRKALIDAGVDITSAEFDDSAEFTALNEAHALYGTAADELSALENRREKLWSMAADRSAPADERRAVEGVKDGLRSSESWGERIISGRAYQNMREAGLLNSSARIGNVALGEMMDRQELHSLIVGTEGGTSSVAPFVEPTSRGLVDPRFRPLLLTDLITVLQTDSDSVDYVVETLWDNNAAPVAEATASSGSSGTKPESDLRYEKKDASVKTIAHWIAATRRALSDVPRLRSLIETRLRRGLEDVLEDQIVAGNGSGENLEGVLSNDDVQYQDRTSDPLVEDVLRAMTKVRLAYFEPTATALHPNDWETIRLMREGSGSGQYLFGPPSQAGATTLWGLPVVSGAQFIEDRPVVADWRVVELYIREGVQVLASDSHEDFFTRNLVAILAEMRVALAIPQPLGVCEIREGS